MDSGPAPSARPGMTTERASITHGVTSSINAQRALIDTRSGMVRGLARPETLALQSMQQAPAMNRAWNKNAGGRHDNRAVKPSHALEIFSSRRKRNRALARDRRPRRSGDLEAQVLLVAAERSQIRQRPRLLRQPRQEPEGERARRAG